ncbi:hypothetical protein AB6818_04645 [Carnobacterium maltaromaticum]
MLVLIPVISDDAAEDELINEDKSVLPTTASAAGVSLPRTAQMQYETMNM